MGNIGTLIDGALKKEWSDDEVDKYVGAYTAAYLTHSSDQVVRDRAASGGTTSALLIHGLKTGLIDGAVVCKVVLEGAKVRPHFYIARSEEEVLAARGSKYVETRFLREVLPLCREFDGKLAVVGLPCDITALRRRCSKEPELGRKVVLTFALVCGHNSRTELIDHVTDKLSREANKKLVDYRFRVGHWRGLLEAEFEGGYTLQKPTKYFNDYQNLFFFCERKCMACHDHYGYNADISVGDIWLFHLKADSVKHTAIIVRNECGEHLYESATKCGDIISAGLDIRSIMDGQSRIGPSHYNVTARKSAGKVFGLKLKDNVSDSISWHSYLNAFITIGNMRLSEKSWGRRLIFFMPRPVLKAYLYFKKGLESIK